MSCEVKFRVWDDENKKMIFPSQEFRFMNCFLMEEYGIKSPFINFALMQYIGMQDKNKKTYIRR